VYGTEDIDVAALLKDFAIDMTLRPAGVKNAGDRIEASLGAKIGGGSDAVLLQVYDDGAAQRAGLSAGDVVMALDGLRVNAATLDKRICSYTAQSCVVLSVFRRDELMTFDVTLLPQPATTCVLTTRLEPAAGKAARLAWLGAVL